MAADTRNRKGPAHATPGLPMGDWSLDRHRPVDPARPATGIAARNWL